MGIPYMYGEAVALELEAKLPDFVCECCGERDMDKLSRVPAIMGGTPLRAQLSKTDRFICGVCFEIWHEQGLTDPNEIGRRHHEAKASGTYPFGKRCGASAATC